MNAKCDRYFNISCPGFPFLSFVLWLHGLDDCIFIFEASRSCICLISAVWTQLCKHFTTYILIYLSVYSELHVVFHVSSLSSESKTAFIQCKTQNQRQDFQGIWRLLEFAILKSLGLFFYSLSKQWSKSLLSMWIIPLTRCCPSWDVTWCNYGSKKGKAYTVF